MGKLASLIIPNHTIVEALPYAFASKGYTDQIWKYRRKLKLSEAVTREIARAHCEIAQEVGCVVRMKPRGPRGGRGQMHYNGGPELGAWWPASWNHAPKGATFYLVTETVELSHYDRALAGAQFWPGTSTGWGKP